MPGSGVVARGGIGVFASGDKGVSASGEAGPGIEAFTSADAPAGTFESRRPHAQVLLIPIEDGITDPSMMPGSARAGELLVLLGPPDKRGHVEAGLWFCTSTKGLAATAKWARLA